MLDHPLHCECRHCTAERKIVVQNWTFQNRLDRARKHGDTVEEKNALNGIDELADKMQKLTQEPIEVES